MEVPQLEEDRNASQKKKKLTKRQKGDLGGSQTTSLELVETSWTSQNLPPLPRRFPGDFPGTALSVDYKILHAPSSGLFLATDLAISLRLASV